MQPHGGVVVRLGSQVDVVMPFRPEIRVDVRAGERVYAGRSVLARLDDQHP